MSDKAPNVDAIPDDVIGPERTTITQTEMLDAFEIYEHALSELIDKKSAQ